MPDGAIIDSCTLTGGKYGNKDTDMAVFSTNGNLVTVDSTRKLDAGEGVTIMVNMPEGTFSEALVWQPKIIFHNITADYRLDDHGILTVVKTYDATINDKISFRMTMDDEIKDCSDKILSASITYPNSHTEEVTDDYPFINFDDYVGERVQFSCQYQKAFNVPIGFSDATLSADVYDYYLDHLIENVLVTYTVPFAVDSPYLSKYSNNSSYGNYTADSKELSSSSTSGTFSLANHSNDADDIYLHLPMPHTDFVRNHTVYDWLVPVVGILLVILSVLFLLHRKEILNPVPAFYPPDGLNPAELGFIIDNKCQTSDVISLIYYWASKGLLSIQFKKDHFTLTKLNSIDNSYRQYEQTLFNRLWNNGKRNTVSDHNLKESFYKHVEKAMISIQNQFKKDTILIDPASVRLSKLMGMLLPSAYLLLLTIADWSRGFNHFGSFLSSVLCLIGIAVLRFIVKCYVKRRYQNQSKTGVFIGSAIIIGTTFLTLWMRIDQRVLTSVATLITFLCLITLTILGPFFMQHTAYGREMLEKAVGFKIFLTTAEKDRLKMLLDDNPDYYYDILPYAQVLGVTKQWINRFDGLMIETPDWLQSDRPINAYDYQIFHQMTNSMTSSMTSTPSSSDSSGGYSGGGFSGGGSGGGGGSSW